MSQARPGDAALLRPSKLGSEDSQLVVVEHTLSKFCRDPCSVGRVLAAAVKCYKRKAPIFLVEAAYGMAHDCRWHCSQVSVR